MTFMVIPTTRQSTSRMPRSDRGIGGSFLLGRLLPAWQPPERNR